MKKKLCEFYPHLENWKRINDQTDSSFSKKIGPENQ